MAKEYLVRIYEKNPVLGRISSESYDAEHGPNGLKISNIPKNEMNLVLRGNPDNLYKSLADIHKAAFNGAKGKLKLAGKIHGLEVLAVDTLAEITMRRAA